MSDTATDTVEETLPFEEFSYYDIKDVPEPEWLVEDLMQELSYGMIYGSPSSGKTFAMLTLMLCIATGTPFFGKKVKKGKVLYFFGEGRAGIQKRIAIWLSEHPEVDPEDVKNNLRLIPMVPSATNYKHLVSVKLNCKGASLIVFDTYARLTRGVNENDAREVGLVNQWLQSIRDEVGISVWVLHHTEKSGTSERGSNSLRADQDTAIIMKRGTSGEVILGLSKMKDWEDTLTMSFNLESREVMNETTGKLIKSALLVRRVGHQGNAFEPGAKYGVRAPQSNVSPYHASNFT